MTLNIIKWSATLGIIAATMLRAGGYHLADMVVGGIATIMWAYAAYKMKDTPLFAVNGFCVLVLAYGITK